MKFGGVGGGAVPITGFVGFAGVTRAWSLIIDKPTLICCQSRFWQSSRATSEHAMTTATTLTPVSHSPSPFSVGARAAIFTRHPPATQTSCPSLPAAAAAAAAIRFN